MSDKENLAFQLQLVSWCKEKGYEEEATNAQFWTDFFEDRMKEKK